MSLRAWNAVAPGWANTRHEINTREQPVTDRMHDALGMRAGDLILEMCAGPGEVGLQLAEKYPAARVIISDFAPAMVDVATTEGERRGVANFEARVIDAQNIDLPDASVDGIVCRFGLMLVPDIPRAFAEARRVLRPGRTLVYTTWAPLDANPWMAVFGGAMIQRGHFTPPEGRAFMPLSTPEENIAVARAAGFDVIDANRLIVRSAEDISFYRDDLSWIPDFIAKNRHYRIEAVAQRVPSGQGYYNAATQRIVAHRADADRAAAR